MDSMLPSPPAGSATSAPVVFTARGVGKVYRTGEVEVVALREVSLQIHRGEFVVLLGASGSGKSTLLNILGGLDVPSMGEVRFGDQVLTAANEAELTRYRREHVGFVFQFYNLIPSLTVRENVQLVTDIAPQAMPVDEAIALVGLTPRRDHFPAQLSGGEQQRVAIARAIVKRPEVLLCDEPTGALDYATGKLVLEVIARINRELGTTAVVITHNAAIAGMADRVQAEVLEGRPRTLELTLQATVAEMMGLNAYMTREALNRVLGDGEVAGGFMLALDPGAEPGLLQATRQMPRVAGAFSKASMLRNMEEVSARNIRIMSAVLTAFASVIAVGVVYNNARIQLAERTWELASLRVLGFTRAEVSALLLGEMAIVIALALPLGMGLG
jgi:putative ABC transport system ATP-binding protein